VSSLFATAPDERETTPRSNAAKNFENVILGGFGYLQAPRFMELFTSLYIAAIG
jgi:hypothetical protein